MKSSFTSNDRSIIPYKEVTINPMSDDKITIMKLHKTNKSRK